VESARKASRAGEPIGALPLVAVLHLRRLAQVGTYLADEPGKPLDLPEQGRVLQVMEHLPAVAHRIGVVQRCEQDPRDEIALLAVTRDRGHDLVQVQVPRKGAIRGDIPGRPRPSGQQSRASE